MNDREAIAKELAKPLDRKHVKPPPQGKYGEYIEGWHAIAECNRIFGWDGWDYALDRLDVTNCDERNGQWAVGYIAVVTVVAQGTRRTDVGHGQGHHRSLGDAHDSAAKEATTDALKRALRTFGNPLGLALYDKTKANVSDNPNYDPKAAADFLLASLERTKDADLAKWKADNLVQLEQLGDTDDAEFDRVSKECIRRAKALKKED